MKALITLIFIGALVALGIMVGRGNPGTATPSPSPSVQETVSANTPSGDPSPTSEEGQGASAPTGRIFAKLMSGTTNEIFTVDVVTKQKKVIFTDKNDSEKIKLVSNVTRSGDSMLVVLGASDDAGGKLYAVKTDGSGQKTLLSDNFVSTNAPLISPDKTKLVTTTFSNAEPNFGFTLNVANLDGKDSQALTTDSSGISHPSFSPDGKTIAFLKGAAASNNKIATVTLGNKEVKTLFESKDKIIEDFDWSSVGLIAFTAAPVGKKAASESEVYLVDPKTSQAIMLTKNNKLERSPRVAPDASGVGYILASSDRIQDLTKPGEITVVSANGANSVTLGSANELLGWVK